MGSKKKKAREGATEPSRDPRNPRKGREGKGKRAQTARSRQVRESAQTDVDGTKAWAERVVDTVELLYRRHQIDMDQRTAARLYLDAWELCQSGVKSCLAGQEGGSGGIASPTEAQLEAARLLAQSSALLGRMDDRLVAAVVGEGRSIEEVAGQLLGVTASGRPKRADSEHVGRRLRLALTELAQAWVVGRRRQSGRLRSAAAPVAPPVTGNRSVERGRVVHATARKVYNV